MQLNLSPIKTTASLRGKKQSDIQKLIDAILKDPIFPNRCMQLFYLFNALGEYALDLQSLALKYSSNYKITNITKPSIQVLVFCVPGDLFDNFPIDLLTENADMQIYLHFLSHFNGLDKILPDHDLVIVGFGESEKNLPYLHYLDKELTNISRPVINSPLNILHCQRDRLYDLLKNEKNIIVNNAKRISRSEIQVADLPFTIRPLDSHAGKNFEFLVNPEALESYLSNHLDNFYYISDFIDYKSNDGLYRKIRIALIDKQPFICHLAISDHWIAHYQSAGMDQHSERRVEEELFMNNFEDDFAYRHKTTLRIIANKINLEYVVIDCAETQDGKFILFEASNIALVHAIDPSSIYPYKKPIMNKVFTAFRNMCVDRHPTKQ